LAVAEPAPRRAVALGQERPLGRVARPLHQRVAEATQVRRLRLRRSQDEAAALARDALGERRCKGEPHPAQSYGMSQWNGSERPPFASAPGPGQESVWDYPRPPKLARDTREVIV